MKLSDREMEILHLIANEKTNLEIARFLHLSLETIRTHRKHILSKLEAINTAGMIRRAFEEKLLFSVSVEINTPNVRHQYHC